MLQSTSNYLMPYQYKYQPLEPNEKGEHPNYAVSINA